MREDWRQAKLGDVAEVGAGNPAPQDKALFRNGRHPFFRTSDVGRVRFGKIAEPTDYLNDEGIAGLRRFPKNTILLPKSGASTFLNHRVLMDIDGFVASHLATIVADNSVVNIQFLFYWLTTVAAQDLIPDSKYPSLKLSDIKKVTIPVPPIAEQETIAAILDDAFAGIDAAGANAEKNLANVRELFESYVNEALSRRGADWAEGRLGDLLQIQRGGSPRPIKAYLTAAADGVNWIKISDATASGKYIYKTKEKIKPSGISRSRMVFDGDFLLSNSMSFGRPYILRTEGCIHDGWLVLRDEDGIFDQDYLYYLLGSAHSFRQFDQLAAGSTVRNLNIDLVSRVSVRYPSREEQSAISTRLNDAMNRTERWADAYRHKIGALADLKQSILQKAFAGELTAKEADKEMAAA